MCDDIDEKNHEIRGEERMECDICKEAVKNDDDYLVHMYINHPEVNENACKMENGEPYKTAEELRNEGIDC